MIFLKVIVKSGERFLIKSVQIFLSLNAVLYLYNYSAITLMPYLSGLLGGVSFQLEKEWVPSVS